MTLIELFWEVANTDLETFRIADRPDGCDIKTTNGTLKIDKIPGDKDATITFEKD